MRKLASWMPGVLQYVGVLLALIGLYLLAGVAWTLLIGGVLVVVYGVLLELGWLSARS